MKYCFVLFIICAATCISSAQDWARDALAKSVLKHEWVTVNAGNHSLATFVAYPDQSSRPVVLLIHDNVGMTDWIQDVATQIAAMGYIVLAPDLLSGMGPNGGRTDSFASQDQVAEAIGKLNAAQVDADLKSVADYGLKLSQSDGRTLMVAGFSWGGSQVFRFAADRDDIIATFVFYGEAPDKDIIGRIKGDVYGFYAGNDPHVDSTLDKTQATAKSARVVYEVVTYDGADPGFMRLGEAPDSGPADKKARLEALVRIKSLMNVMSIRGF
jgi:carboxymethylenebutenolidase